MIDYVAREFDRLVVLQTKVQSQHYKSLHRKKEDFVLPIGPEAMYETEINKWEYCSLGELWTSDDLERENGNTQKKLDELIRKLNAYSHEIDSELNLEIGNYYAFQLWIVVGQIRFNSFIIRRISENLKPKKILCYTKSNRQTFMELRPDPDSIFGDVLIRSQLYKNVKCRVVDIEEQLNHVTLREKILSKLPVFIRVFLRRVRDSYSLVNTHEAIYNLLVIGGHGDWKSLNQFPSFNQVFRMQLPIDLISENGFKDSKLVELINNSIIYDNLLPYDVSKLAESIQADLALFVKKGNIVDKMMQSYDAIVTSVLTFPRDNFLAHRAARAGLPVIVWQHGEKGQTEFELISLYTELFYATDYFAYAPVVVDQYLPWIGKYRLKNVVEVGSIEKQIEWEGGESVVYATGKWFKTTLAGDHDRRLFKAHTTILGYLERYADKYPIIFKANNTPGLNVVPYQYEKITVEYERSFVDCLKSAKVVILDTPATTLIEACSTNVPIFVLGGRSEYTDDFLKAVKKRVVWCEDLEILLKKLNVFFSTGTYEADVEDKSFLRNYGAGKKIDEVKSSVQDRLLYTINESRKNQ